MSTLYRDLCVRFVGYVLVCQLKHQLKVKSVKFLLKLNRLALISLKSTGVLWYLCCSGYQSWLNWRELWYGNRCGNWPSAALSLEMFWSHSQHACCFHLCCVQASHSEHCGLGSSDACWKTLFTVFLGARSPGSLLSKEIFLGDFPLWSGGRKERIQIIYPKFGPCTYFRPPESLSLDVMLASRLRLL